MDAKKPLAFVAENVKGILTANGKKAIQQIIEDFQNIEPGYVVIPKLYNFADYGVPEFRERVLIVGIRSDTGFDFVHPSPSHGEADGLLPYVTVGDAFKGVADVPHNNEHLRITARTEKVISLIPEGGNFTAIPKDSPWNLAASFLTSLPQCWIPWAGAKCWIPFASSIGNGILLLFSLRTIWMRLLRLIG